MGFLECGTAAQEILAGTYQCPTDTDEYTKLFIEALRWPTLCPDIISSILNMENFCNHWWRAWESTSSSFSGLHFGHYKVAASTPTIAHLHACFIQLVFMSGILLSQYQSGLQVILEKSGSNTCGSPLGHPFDGGGLQCCYENPDRPQDGLQCYQEPCSPPRMFWESTRTYGNSSVPKPLSGR